MTPISHVCIVFAGGPHTATRAALAKNVITADLPDITFLTGQEFETDYGATAETISRALDARPVITDQQRTTLASCRHVTRLIAANYPHARITVVTSNYHERRVKWLLRAALPRFYSLSFQISPDMHPAQCLRDALARRLLFGELCSWIYCGPIGAFWFVRRVLNHPRRER